MGQGPLERRTDRTRADRVEGPAGVASDHSGRQPLRPVLDEGLAAAATSCRVVVGRAVDALGPTVQPAEVPPGRRAQGAGGFHEEEDELVVLLALSVVVVAWMVGHAADAARVRPSVVAATRANTPDLANGVLQGVAEAVGGAPSGEVSVRDRGRVGVEVGPHLNLDDEVAATRGLAALAYVQAAAVVEELPDLGVRLVAKDDGAAANRGLMAVVEDTECAVVGRGLVRARFAGEAVAPWVVVVADAARGGEGGYGSRNVKAEAALERVSMKSADSLRAPRPGPRLLAG